jgi:hypothetical protein
MTMPGEALPDLYQAQLDDETLAALFADLAALGHELEVAVKQHAQGFSEERSSWTLAEAQRALCTGEVRGVQVRYAHQGAVWLDTVVRSGSAYRLVRMQVPRASALEVGAVVR